MSELINIIDRQDVKQSAPVNPKIKRTIVKVEPKELDVTVGFQESKDISIMPSDGYIGLSKVDIKVHNDDVLEEKTVSTTIGKPIEITPSEGIMGMSKVTVNQAPYGIVQDANGYPTNIGFGGTSINSSSQVLDLSKWNFSKYSSLNYLFAGVNVITMPNSIIWPSWSQFKQGNYAISAKHIFDGASIDTVPDFVYERLTEMKKNNWKFDKFNLSYAFANIVRNNFTFDYSKVPYYGTYMFAGNYSQKLDTTKDNPWILTGNNPADFSGVFRDARNLKTMYIKNQSTLKMYFSNTFTNTVGSTKLTEFGFEGNLAVNGAWTNTFKNCSKLTKVSLGTLNYNEFSGIYSMILNSTFEGCTSLSHIDIDLKNYPGITVNKGVISGFNYVIDFSDCPFDSDTVTTLLKMTTKGISTNKRKVIFKASVYNALTDEQKNIANTRMLELVSA